VLLRMLSNVARDSRAFLFNLHQAERSSPDQK
jgi:hypothetical protein